jgi:hypothetical protein
MALLSSSSRCRLARAVRQLGVAGLLAVAARPALRAADLAPAAAISAEYRVKAGFIFNFLQFIEWPARALGEPPSPIVIGVLGEDPFGSYLDELVQGEKVGERPIVVRRFRRGEEITGCHLLFLSRSETAQFEKIISALTGRSVLTVGDADGFERAGGIVRFAIEAGKIRLRINPDAAKAAELTISSKLLRLATLVTRDKG